MAKTFGSKCIKINHLKKCAKRTYKDYYVTWALGGFICGDGIYSSLDF